MSDYGSMYVKDLRAELHRRDAKVSGKKKDLIDR